MIYIRGLAAEMDIFRVGAIKMSNIIALLRFIFGPSKRRPPIRDLQDANQSWVRAGATTNQVRYLEGLVKVNNLYRGNPWTIQDWVDACTKGKWSFWSARFLIKKIKEENEAQRQEFRRRVRFARGERKQKKFLLASDFASYGFCQNAYYWQSRSYISRNLYELNQGKIYHGDFSKPNGSLNQNTQYIKESVADVVNVEWFRGQNQETIFNRNKKLAGIPDGMIRFESGSLAIVEVKSSRLFPIRQPYRGDVLQACAYWAICKGGSNPEFREVSVDVYILYVHKESTSRQIFKIDSAAYLEDLGEAIHEMAHVKLRPHLYRSTTHERKCISCGYRHVCEKVARKSLSA